ncbi:MAG TPA: hypothetical protein VM283_03980, partial [Armatimonadota bacterium]|nr:hypothetical protein [Armatimonadota bacterium]
MAARLVTIAALCAALLSSAAAQQPPVFDSFEAPALDGRWTVDSSRDCALRLDPQRQVLMLEGMEHRYNHIETPWPEGARRLQVDVCNISDTAASWSPSVILYWGEGDWARLMISLTYSLRLHYSAGGEEVIKAGGLRIVPGAWYRVGMELTGAQVMVTCGEVGQEPVQVATVPRPASWSQPPTIILGKGYMQRMGGRPDFDNDYGRTNKRVRDAYDNFVIGDPAAVAEQIEASVARRVVVGEHDPAKLQVALWPGVTHPETEQTVWLAPSIYQRLSLIYSNYDDNQTAADVRFELETPVELGVEDITFGPYELGIERSEADG